MLAEGTGRVLYSHVVSVVSSFGIHDSALMAFIVDHPVPKMYREVNICKPVSIYIYTHIFVNVFIYTYTYTCLNTYTYRYVHIRAYVQNFRAGRYAACY